MCVLRLMHYIRYNAQDKNREFRVAHPYGFTNCGLKSSWAQMAWLYDEGGSEIEFWCIRASDNSKDQYYEVHPPSAHISASI
ncbi:unnamed protein product [Gongylonema pulchrum]|uniref:S-protein homolog n=1 Tax=Gongylonema pulchrum TaxID=637853 RepID=A0A183D2H1_9BILA|nr:unnamed protein product [Gongylonema pulchrum]